MAYDKRYYIYILSSPITQETFYVGCTHYLKIRRRQHFLKHRDKFNGMPPVFTIIDTIWARGWAKPLDLEKYWINKMLVKGHRLINKRMVARIKTEPNANILV